MIKANLMSEKKVAFSQRSAQSLILAESTASEMIF